MVSSLGGSHVLSQYIKVRPLATPRHSPVFHRSISSLHSVGLEKLRSIPLVWYGQNLDRNENIIFLQKGRFIKEMGNGFFGVLPSLRSDWTLDLSSWPITQ